MTAYEILNSTDAPVTITEVEFYNLINQFAKSYLLEFKYHEGVSITREPTAFRNGILNELSKIDLEIQSRPEMRYHDEDQRLTGYIPSAIKQIWIDDKRLKSLYNATTRFCYLYKKEFLSIAIHIAEYRAIRRLENWIKRDIRKDKVSIVSLITPQKSTKKRAAIPKKILVRLHKESNNQCPFCDFEDPAHLEVHHIDEDRTHKDPARLIMVCPTCHSKINSGEITRQQVEARKKEMMSNLETTIKTEKKVTVTADTANISIGNHATVIVKESKKKIIQKYPPGCIGYDSKKTNYISYLIKRYHQYKEWEVGKDEMNYARLNSQLKKQFKIGNQRTVYNIAIEFFDDVVKHLQNKIDNTKLGRINGKKQSNYSLFIE